MTLKGVGGRKASWRASNLQPQSAHGSHKAVSGPRAAQARNGINSSKLTVMWTNMMHLY